VLCSPNGLHAEQAICLQAGAHVVVQKHLTLDIATSGRVVEEADRRDLLLSVVSQRRFEPPALAVKQASTAVSSYYDEIGWRGSVDLDGGALMNQGIHAVDLMRWLFGEVTTVQGQVATRVRDIEAEDTAVACLRFASGGFGVISATTATTPGLPAEINLIFEHGSVSLADDRIVRWAVPGVDQPSLRYDSGSGSQAAKNITAIGHTRQWDDIMAALRDRRPPAVTGRDALGTAALIVAIQRSSATGAPIEEQPS